MAWNYQSSVGRAQVRWDATSDLTVSDVVRQTDFDQIALNAPRRVAGCHLYVDVTNFNALLRDASNDVDPAELVRLLHVWQREVSSILSAFDVRKIHFQGPRLHAVSYRPVSDATEQVARATLAALAIRHAALTFVDVFGVPGWVIAAGLDHGETVATRNGAAGDRELLFLGHAANHAAKTLRATGIRLTADASALLPAEFEDYMSVGDITTVTMSADVVADFASERGCDWSRDKSATRLHAAATSFPSGCVSVSGVKESIDKDKLTLSNTKAVLGASIFADVDGFTAYIDDLIDVDDDLVDAIRRFHVLRGEGRDTAVRDFGSLRIQYQGDRMQVITYTPIDNATLIATNAVELATALNSVATKIVPSVCDGDFLTPLAIGVAVGQVLVTKIGEQGNRDLISVGQSTADAASIQQRLKGGQIGVDSVTWNALPAWLQNAFAWDSSVKAYVVTDFLHSDFVTLKTEENSRSLASVASKSFAAPIEEPLRPWHVG